MKKYMFCITLEGGVEVYSDEYDGVDCYVPMSQAPHYMLKGIFDSYEEALQEKDNVCVYTFVVYPNRNRDDAWEAYDPQDEGSGYFYFENVAEDAAFESFGDRVLYADECRIEALNAQDAYYFPGKMRFKYSFYFQGVKVVDCGDLGYDNDYFETYEEAEDDANFYLIDEDDCDKYNYYVMNGAKYQIYFEPQLGIDYDLTTIDIENIEIIEFEYDENDEE